MSEDFTDTTDPVVRRFITCLIAVTILAIPVAAVFGLALRVFFWATGSLFR